MRPRGWRLVKGSETPWGGRGRLSHPGREERVWDISRPSWEGASSLAPLLPLVRKQRVLVAAPSGGLTRCSP